jgi:hypothetical protein
MGKPKKPQPLKKSKVPQRVESTPGPKPDVLKIDENWKDAIKKSFSKKKPAEGWPA